MKEVILTGIRSNEEPTIGNYLGAMLPMINMQKELAGKYRINMFVPDLHSFTTPINHEVLYEKTLNNIKYYLAAGLNPNNDDTLIYRQSFVPAHSQMTWILDCFTYVGEMGRMTQFKEKSSEHSSSVTMGLMNYPVLMAADILLYGAKYVPVGEDQRQHLEITRDIAIRFNNKFGDIFVIPEATKDQDGFMHRDSGLRIRSLTNPEKKMSKSSDDEKSKICLNDSPSEARKKIMSATTDSIGQINFDWNNQPGIANLLQILALFSGRTQQEVNGEWQGSAQYGQLKQAVADVIEAFLNDFQSKYNNISDDELIEIMERHEAEARDISNQTLQRAQEAVGLRRS